MDGKLQGAEGRMVCERSIVGKKRDAEGRSEFKRGAEG